MDHYQSWTDLSITEVVWDHLDREQKNRSQHPKKSFESTKKWHESFSKRVRTVLKNIKCWLWISRHKGVTLHYLDDLIRSVIPIGWSVEKTEGMIFSNNVWASGHNGDNLCSKAMISCSQKSINNNFCNMFFCVKPVMQPTTYRSEPHF